MYWATIYCLLFSVLCQCSLVVSDDSRCPAQPSPQNLPSEIPSQIIKAFHEVYDLGSSFIDHKILPGVTIGITYNGKTVFSKGAGVKSKDDPNHTPPDPDTIFRIGSVSKIFPAIMVYQLYESGFIHSLDDPLSKYAPDFSINNPFSNSNITIRQMASQLSGLQRETPCNDTKNVMKTCQLSNEEMLKTLSSEYLILPPWTKPSYSNLAFALLGRLLVRLVDKYMTFEEYVQIEILSQLELSNTGFKITEEVKSKMAVGYMFDGSVAPLTDYGWEAPAGQMYSSLNDLNKLSKFFYEAYFLRQGDRLPHSEDVLKAVTRREMALPYFVNPDRETGFGTPWEIMYRYNYTIRTKGGNVNGYSALFSYIPELHLGVNALFSGAFEGSIFAAKAFDILIPPIIEYLSILQPNLRAPPNPQVYTGTFVGGGVEVTIFEQGNFQPLYARSGNRTDRLDYFEKDKMQSYFDESVYPCMENELLGGLGEWVYFDSNYHNSKSPGFTIPGQFPSVYFKRI